MKDENEKWIDDVINSMNGSQKAKPSAGLSNRINNQINNHSAKIISMDHWRISISAAVVIFILNIFVMQKYLTVNDLSNSPISLEENTSDQIISDYKLYD